MDWFGQPKPSFGYALRTLLRHDGRRWRDAGLLETPVIDQALKRRAQDDELKITSLTRIYRTYRRQLSMARADDNHGVFANYREDEVNIVGDNSDPIAQFH